MITNFNVDNWANHKIKFLVTKTHCKAGSTTKGFCPAGSATGVLKLKILGSIQYSAMFQNVCLILAKS